MVQKQRGKRKEYMVQIGELLMQVLEEQREKIREVTYDSVKPSYYEAGEILAKKVLKMV